MLSVCLDHFNLSVYFISVFSNSRVIQGKASYVWYMRVIVVVIREIKNFHEKPG